MLSTAKVLSVFALVSLLPLGAAPIPGLFNTGVVTNSVLLGNNAVDPHWRLIFSDDSSTPGPQAYVVDDGQSPLVSGPWMASGPNSKWIAPLGNQSTGNAPGRYTFRISFDLTGLDPLSAVITGKWATDDGGTDIVINGHSTGLKTTGYQTFSPVFTISNVFVAGINTIDFGVTNWPPGVNPTGFRAELSGTANADVPSNTPPSILSQPVSLN